MARSTGSSAGFAVYWDPANAIGAMTNLVASHGPFGPGAFMGTSMQNLGPAAGPPMDEEKERMRRLARLQLQQDHRPGWARPPTWGRM